MKDNRLDVDLGGIEAKLEWETNKISDQLSKVSDPYEDEINEVNNGLSKYKNVKDNELSKKEKDDFYKLKKESDNTFAKIYRDQAKLIYDFKSKGNDFPKDEFFKSDDFPIGQHKYNLMVFRNPQILT